MSKAEKRACQYTGYCRNQSYSDFLNGYRQAEKDLALTWEDIRDICRMWIESKTPFGVTGEALSIEVLNRFNKQKENKA